MLRVGVDVGGTHTDLVLIDEEHGDVVVHKVPTTVGDPALGAITGLQELCRKAGIAPAAIDYFMHGTTIATNILPLNCAKAAEYCRVPPRISWPTASRSNGPVGSGMLRPAAFNSPAAPFTPFVIK